MMCGPRLHRDIRESKAASELCGFGWRCVRAVVAFYSVASGTSQSGSVRTCGPVGVCAMQASSLMAVAQTLL